MQGPYGQIMFSYSFQVALTLACGPLTHVAYRIYRHSRERKHLPVDNTQDRFIRALSDLQVAFFDGNIFLIFTTAIASLVRLEQGPTIFELAEMQILMAMQLLSLIIIFFTLIHPVARWWLRFFQFAIGFIMGAVAMDRSQINGHARHGDDWKMTVAACSANSTVYRTISPLTYPSWLVGVVAGICLIAFATQSLSAERTKALLQRHPHWRWWLFSLGVVWGILVTASMVGMIYTLYLLWAQRDRLFDAIGDEQTESNGWEFGQVAALLTWLSIPVEVFYQVHGEYYPCLIYFITFGGQHQQPDWVKEEGYLDSLYASIQKLKDSILPTSLSAHNLPTHFDDNEVRRGSHEKGFVGSPLLSEYSLVHTTPQPNVGN